MKKFFIIFFFINSFLSSFSCEEVYKDEMKKLIYEIRLRAKDKIIITQNGTDIYFKNNEIDEDFFKYTDGVSQESLFYGESGVLGKKTSKKEKNYLLQNLIELKKRGKVVFNVNYSKNKLNRKKIRKENEKYNFIGEEIVSYTADRFNIPINNFNENNIFSLEDAKNFLYFLNPHKFKNIDEYFRALSGTDYDVLIIEPSVNGKFFTKEQISKLKYKSTGERRLVISYFSIGESEDYRYYWKKSWNKKFPNWIKKENENWKGNYIVEYWNKEWKKIIIDYQKKLDFINVDGYYLDTIDSYYYFENKK